MPEAPLSDAVYRRLIRDAHPKNETGPGGHQWRLQYPAGRLNPPPTLRTGHFPNPPESNARNLWMSKIKEGSYPPDHPEQRSQAKAGAATPVGKVQPMVTVVCDVSEGSAESAAAAITEPVAGSASLINEIVCEGARRILAEALQAEVAAYIERFAGELDEGRRRLVVRNGSHQPRRVLTSAGVVEVLAPVNDRRVDPDTR